MALDLEIKYYTSDHTWEALPSPVAIIRKREQIWSSNTGRNTSGMMKGEVVATKRTFDVTWGLLTASQYNEIASALETGFQNLMICGTEYEVYHGTLEAEFSGAIGSGTNKTIYYKSVKTELIER